MELEISTQGHKMLKRRDRYGNMYFFGFADLGFGFAGIGDFENPRLQNPGFCKPDVRCDVT